MTESSNRALLPAGLRDILPPQAAREAEIVTKLMDGFAGHGYERVKPPLIEFEESLLAGSGAAMAKHTFRVMDPVSQRMMGVRADMTPQVARIAITRLVNEPRPLRLSYAGQVLRVKGNQLRPERQFGQAGIELIGADGARADAEVVILAAEAVRSLGVDDVSVDLTLPTLVPLVVKEMGGERDGLKDALEHKDVAAVLAAKGEVAKVLAKLIEAVGPADAALAKLCAIDLPPQARALKDRLGAVLSMVKAAVPGLTLTVDPVESRGFEYHTGLAFTLFARELTAELGRGGRYLADGEPAVGATLFMDTVIEASPPFVPARKVFLPVGISRAEGDKLRGEGWVTLAGLNEGGNPLAEAGRMGCTHALIDGALVPISRNKA